MAPALGKNQAIEVNELINVALNNAIREIEAKFNDKFDMQNTTINKLQEIVKKQANLINSISAAASNPSTASQPNNRQLFSELVRGKKSAAENNLLNAAAAEVDERQLRASNVIITGLTFTEDNPDHNLKAAQTSASSMSTQTRSKASIESKPAPKIL